MTLEVHSFFDQATNSYTYLVEDSRTRAAAVIDPVLDFDPAAGLLGTAAADRVSRVIDERDLDLEWLLETHVHADHLSAATVLKQRHGGRSVIGARVIEVQQTFAGLFNAEDLRCDGSAFDRLVHDGDVLELGDHEIRVIETPGHTPTCVTYLIEGAAFVGDTLFMPDFGTARCDFPGGDAKVLYNSIQRLFALPGETRLYLCHDYPTATRSDLMNETTVAEERQSNIHLGSGVPCDAFTNARRSRDQELSAPRLMLPSVQFNMRGGQFPPAEANGQHYFKIPVAMA